MGYLKFIRAGSKFTAVPKTAGSFHSFQVNEAGNNTNGPPGNVVDTFITHIMDLSKEGTNIKL